MNILTTEEIKQLASAHIKNASVYHWLVALATAKDFKESGLLTWTNKFHVSKMKKPIGGD